MIATAIIPQADVLPLPAPPGLLHFLMTLTFLLHLLAMNALLGGLLITFWLRLKGGVENLAMADRMAKVTPSLVAGAVTLGVAPLLFIQVLFGQFIFTSSILMGWGWFSVVVVLIVAYYGTYLQSFKGDRLGGARNALLGLTVLLFLWISFMFSNNMSLMLNVHAWADMYFDSPKGLHLNLADYQLYPRWLHMVAGAVAVAGFMAAWWGRISFLRGNAAGEAMFGMGRRVFLWGTGLNIGLGLWYYLALDKPVRQLFMGGDMGATLLFGIGFVLSLAILVLGILGRRQGPAEARWTLMTVLLFVDVVVMILMRDGVRQGYLAEYYQPHTFPVLTQYFNLVLFGVLLIAGVGVVVWMFRALFSPAKT